MASTSRKGRPPRDLRQLDLNFYFNATNEQGSNGDSTMFIDEGGDVERIVLLVNTSTPNIREVQLLHHLSRIFKGNFIQN
jgi:hypothetical protein